MSEDNYRNQVNAIYGAPCEIVAMGHDRNLVQAAEPPRKRKEVVKPRDELQDLESILEFGYGAQLKKEANENRSKRDRRISQAGIVCEKKLSVLRKLLEFTGVL